MPLHPPERGSRMEKAAHTAEQPLLTLFTAPKPFDREHIALIQRNALRSWLALGPAVEVLLIGDEPGVSEVAQEMGIRHLPEVGRNAHGTPRIDAMFALARRYARAPFLGYVNADILLTSDLLAALRTVAAQVSPFLLVGRRWDLDVKEALTFDPGWEERLRRWVRRAGRLHSRAGIDFFVFPREAFQDVPPLVVGRAGWDNWMIYHAREQGWPVVDATPTVLVVHQNHDYAHLPSGQAPYKVAEALENIRLAGGKARMYTLWEATHTLREGRLRPLRYGFPGWLRRLELALVRRYGEPPRGWPRRALRFIRRTLRRWD